MHASATHQRCVQGDKERELGMDVTPTCDKDVVVVSTSQRRFAKWFVKVGASTSHDGL